MLTTMGKNWLTFRTLTFRQSETLVIIIITMPSSSSSSSSYRHRHRMTDDDGKWCLFPSSLLWRVDIDIAVFSFIETVCLHIRAKQFPKNANLSHAVNARGSKPLCIRPVLNKSICCSSCGMTPIQVTNMFVKIYDWKNIRESSLPDAFFPN